MILKQLPKCDTDTKWTNTLGKMVLMAWHSVATNFQFGKSALLVKHMRHEQMYHLDMNFTSIVSDLH